VAPSSRLKSAWDLTTAPSETESTFPEDAAEEETEIDFGGRRRTTVGTGAASSDDIGFDDAAPATGNFVDDFADDGAAASDAGPQRLGRIATTSQRPSSDSSAAPAPSVSGISPGGTRAVRCAMSRLSDNRTALWSPPVP
jgi:hypothetical protein